MSISVGFFNLHKGRLSLHRKPPGNIQIGTAHLFKCHSAKQMKTDPPRDKTNKMTLHLAKTQISLGIRPVWSVFAVYSMGS